MTIVLDFPHIDRRRKPVTAEVKNGCWECTSHYSDRVHHPRFRVKGVKTTIHRYIYELCYGKIYGPELVVRHKCDNIKCINPAHLELGTQLDNIEDMFNRNRGHIKTFTDDQIREIRDIKLPTKYLSEKYNVTKRTILNIKNRASYKHVI